MKNTKKSILVIFGAVAIALLMVSTATAVKQVNGAQVSKNAGQVNQLQSLSDESEAIPLLPDIDEDDILGFLEGFRTYFMSVEFADLMKSDVIQDLIASGVFMDVYNSDAVQDFINSDDFVEFMNSDEVQTYLGNYFDGGDNPDESAINLAAIAGFIIGLIIGLITLIPALAFWAPLAIAIFIIGSVITMMTEDPFWHIKVALGCIAIGVFWPLICALVGLYIFDLPVVQQSHQPISRMELY